MAASTSKNVIFAALAGNTAIARVKFAAALVTGSAAMMSEAIHSTVDTSRVRRHRHPRPLDATSRSRYRLDLRNILEPRCLKA